MSTQAFDPTRDHRITREEAAELVKAFQTKAKAKADDYRASAFNRSAFDQLLAQPNAAGIRIYRALHKDGSPTMVMVAVDQAGQDIAGEGAVIIQNAHDCPPWCVTSSLF